jgi:hypothetical protein
VTPLLAATVAAGLVLATGATLMRLDLSRAAAALTRSMITTEPAGAEPGAGPAPSHVDSPLGPGAAPVTGLAATESPNCAPPRPRGTPNQVALPSEISPGYLRTNQRTGAAAVRRANAIDAWLNAGIVDGDFCGGALSRDDLDSRIVLVTRDPAATPPASNSRTVRIERGKTKDTVFVANATQMCINQRIYQAGIARANALRARIAGRLTGGDIVDGTITQDRLRGDLMIAAATADPRPAAASRTNVRQPVRQGCGVVRFTPQQAAINRRIAIQSVVRINRVLDKLASGLTGDDFVDGTITKVDFVDDGASSPDTSSPDNSFEAGTVQIGDNGGGSAMFQLSALRPGRTEERCITVTYTGSLTSDVRLYGAIAGVTGLDEFLDLEVERGFIPEPAPPFADCTGFTAVERSFSGTLRAFVAGHGDFGTGIPGWDGVNTGARQVYKFSVALQDDNAAQGLRVDQVVFTWEARNT